MPILDMPLSELKEYGGMNPRPEDFDEFWDESLEEMRKTLPEVELKKADFQTDYAECYYMFFNGTRGGRVAAKLVMPKNKKEKMPAVLHFHGYSGMSAGWLEYVPYAAAGYVVAAMDCRGQAGLSGDYGRYEGNTLAGFVTKGLIGDPKDTYYRNVFLDTAQLARIIMDMPEVDENRVGAYGGSQGGGLTIACAALEPRIRFAAPAYPFLSDYKRTWHMDLDKDAYNDLRVFFRQRDMHHEHEDEYFTKLGYTDIQFLAPRIRGEVLMFTGLRDNICPPSTQFAAFNKITSKKDVIIYPDYGHEGLPDYNETVYQRMMQL